VPTTRQAVHPQACLRRREARKVVEVISWLRFAKDEPCGKQKNVRWRKNLRLLGVDRLEILWVI
jgi:hypothetical protein